MARGVEFRPRARFETELILLIFRDNRVNKFVYNIIKSRGVVRK